MSAAPQPYFFTKPIVSAGTGSVTVQVAAPADDGDDARSCKPQPISNGGGKDAFHSVPLWKPGHGEISDALESVLTGTLAAVAGALRQSSICFSARAVLY